MEEQIFRNPAPSDAARCFDIETAAYNAEEAATLETLSKRINAYPQGFLILEVDNVIVGFINSGCAHNVEMSDNAFKELVGHDPDALNVVILSVVVDPKHQGRGFSTALMSEFVARMTELNKSTIHLMCKARLVPLYEKFGYRYTRPSASAYGGAEWHEMMMDLT